MPPIKTHIFRGKRYHIDLDSTVMGWCDTPAEKKNLAIRIFKPLHNTRESMELLLHEALHACFPDMPEKDVDLSAIDLSKFLWRLGYRRRIKE